MKNWDFSKVHGFGKKIKLFHFVDGFGQKFEFFLAKLASEMCLAIIILERKKVFLDSKIRKLKKSKNHGFGQRKGHD